MCQAECCSAGAGICLLPCSACAAVLSALVQCCPAAPEPGAASLPGHYSSHELQSGELKQMPCFSHGASSVCPNNVGVCMLTVRQWL